MPGQLGGQRISVNPQVGATAMQQQQTTAQSTMQHGFPGEMFLSFDFCRQLYVIFLFTEYC